MSVSQEFSQNLLKLKRCKKIYTYTFYFFIAGSIGFLLYGIINLVSVGADQYLNHVIEKVVITPVTTVFCLDALIVAPLTFYLGYRLNFLKHDLCGIIGIMLHTANIILMCVGNKHKLFEAIKLPFYVTVVFGILCIICFALMLRTNAVFRWLEDQVGYPYFNERALEQEFDRKQMEIKSPYQVEMERRMKTASDSMNDIGSTDQTLEKYQATHTESSMESL